MGAPAVCCLLPRWESLRVWTTMALLAALATPASAQSTAPTEAQPAEAQKLTAAQQEAYQGPIFAKGLWRFERSIEVSSRNQVMPNARHLRVDRPVLRCVDPTEAMKETFRPAGVGNCRPTPPQKSQNTYHFANRCDYLGPVRTTIVIDSPISYQETNELKGAAAGKREVVVARRVGECGSTPDLASTATQFDPRDPSSYYNYHPSPR